MGENLILEANDMKKLTATFLVIAFLLAFAACGDEGSTADEGLYSNAESSFTEQSKTESSLPAVSEPEGSSTQESVPEESVPEESVPEQSLPEVSEPEESEPDLSEPEVSEPEEFDPDYSYDDYEWDYTKGFVPFNAAKGYKIVYTKVKPINAVSCTMTDGVAAVYDGKITRFFDALTGEFYTSEIGKWEPVPCGDGFLLNNSDTRHTDWSTVPANVPMIYFDFQASLVDNKYVRELVSIDYDRDHGHGFDSEYYLYDGDTEIIYKVTAGDDVPSYYLGGEGLFTCTLWEDLSKKKVYDFFETEAYQTFKAELPSKKCGLVTNESIIIPFEYDYISDIDRSSYEVGVVMAVKDGKTYYFASDGTNLTPEGFDCGTEPLSNRAWVFKDGYGWIIEFYS